MQQYFGIDPETGLRLFVDSESTLRLELPKCPCCGGENLLAHLTKFGGQRVCRSCGDKWAAYISARSRLGPTSSHRVVVNQLERINFWLSVKEAGGLAPAGLEQDKKNIQNFLQFYGLSEHVQTKKELAVRDGYCAYCGVFTKVRLYTNKPRCPECESRYKRYRYLQTHIGVLTLEECDEFNGILSDYVDLMRKGFWSPDVPKYRKKIRRRMDELV